MYVVGYSLNLAVLFSCFVKTMQNNIKSTSAKRCVQERGKKGVAIHGLHAVALHNGQKKGGVPTDRSGLRWTPSLEMSREEQLLFGKNSRYIGFFQA